MEKYTNDYNKECYQGVMPETPFNDLDFHEVPDQIDDARQVALHTNLGTLTVHDRMTGFGYRDTETGYRAPDGKFWLATGYQDVRQSDAATMQEAIDWVKERATISTTMRRR